MPTPNTLHVQNSIQGITLSMSVDGNGWNCCDAPNPNDHVIDGLGPNMTKSFTFCRKGGHGCDGNQGYFVLDVEGNSASIGSIGFNMDADGNLNVTQPTPAGNQFSCILGPKGDGTFTAVFTHV